MKEINHTLNGTTTINTDNGIATFSSKTKFGVRIISCFIEFPNNEDKWSELADAIEASEIAEVRNYNKRKGSLFLIGKDEYSEISLAEIISIFL